MTFRRPRKSWDELIKNDRKKLDMDSADPQNRSEWRGRLRGRLVKKPNPRQRKTGSKTDMMMMMMIQNIGLYSYQLLDLDEYL